MSAPVSILVFGATGFIGGDILYALLKEAPNSSNPPWGTIGALTSTPSKAKEIESWANSTFPDSASKLKVEVAERSKSNNETFYKSVEQITEQYDLAIQAATSDDLELTKAINRGLEKGKQQNGKLGKLIHFSGTQVIESEPVGEYVDVPLYDDSKPEMIASIPDSAAHRGIDLEIDNARVAGKVDATIICPALVWGKGRGPGGQISVQIPDMVRKAIRNGQPVYVGKGTNSWTNVSVPASARDASLVHYLKPPFALAGQHQRANRLYHRIAQEATVARLVSRAQAVDDILLYRLSPLPHLQRRRRSDRQSDPRAPQSLYRAQVLAGPHVGQEPEGRQGRG